MLFLCPVVADWSHPRRTWRRCPKQVSRMAKRDNRPLTGACTNSKANDRFREEYHAEFSIVFSCFILKFTIWVYLGGDCRWFWRLAVDDPSTVFEAKPNSSPLVVFVHHLSLLPFTENSLFHGMFLPRRPLLVIDAANTHRHPHHQQQPVSPTFPTCSSFSLSNSFFYTFFLFFAVLLLHRRSTTNHPAVACTKPLEAPASGVSPSTPIRRRRTGKSGRTTRRLPRPRPVRMWRCWWSASTVQSTSRKRRNRTRIPVRWPERIGTEDNRRRSGLLVNDLGMPNWCDTGLRTRTRMRMILFCSSKSNIQQTTTSSCPGTIVQLYEVIHDTKITGL